MALPPIPPRAPQPVVPTLPVLLPLPVGAPQDDTAPPPALPLPVPPPAGVKPPLESVLGAIIRAVEALPPGTALSVFLAAVEKVTAEVEARGLEPAVPDDAPLPDALPRSPADPSRLPPPPSMGEVSDRDLAAAAALLAGRLVPDPPRDLSPVSARADDPLATDPIMRDRLYLLPATFADPALPGRSFYCRDCVTVDGLLALFPQAAARIDVIRIDYPRPRGDVIAAIGVANQNLPVLVLAGDADPALADGRHGDVHFVGDIKRLLHALHVRHGFPEAHP